MDTMVKADQTVEKVAKKDILSHYRKWCEEKDVPVLCKEDFGKMMNARFKLTAPATRSAKDGFRRVRLAPLDRDLDTGQSDA